MLQTTLQVNAAQFGLNSPLSCASDFSSGFSCAGGPASNASAAPASPLSSGSPPPPVRGLDTSLRHLFHVQQDTRGGSVTSGHHSSDDFDSDGSVENNLLAHGGGDEDAEDPGVAAMVRALSEHPAVRAAVDAGQQQQQQQQQEQPRYAPPDAVDIDLSLFDQ